MTLKILLMISLVGFIQLMSNCTPRKKHDKFGKSYNDVRLQYGSPVIHGYMLESEMNSDSWQSFETPIEIQDNITTGYHAGKTFYIHSDSILQEDDIFRKRITDTTFAYIGILTFGNRHKHSFRSIYYDITCAKDIQIMDHGKPCSCSFERDGSDEISIQKADSILKAWGTGRFK